MWNGNCLIGLDRFRPQGEVQPGDTVLETGLPAQMWYGESDP